VRNVGCNIVFTQRLKRSGMAWTITGGQVILDLPVLWFRGVWKESHPRYLAEKPLPGTVAETTPEAHRGQQAA
jgi:hypothetical protein